MNFKIENTFVFILYLLVSFVIITLASFQFYLCLFHWFLSKLFNDNLTFKLELNTFVCFKTREAVFTVIGFKTTRLQFTDSIF